MNIQERLRHQASTLRTNSVPLADLIPLLQQAADEIDRLRDERDSVEQELANVRADPDA